MSNHLKFCSCNGCRAGKRSKGAKKKIQNVVRSIRRNAKVDLKLGRDPVSKVSVPYTD